MKTKVKKANKVINLSIGEPVLPHQFPVQQTGCFEDCHIRWAMDAFVSLCETGLKVPVTKIKNIFERVSCRVHPNSLPHIPEWKK